MNCEREVNHSDMCALLQCAHSPRDVCMYVRYVLCMYVCVRTHLGRHLCKAAHSEGVGHHHVANARVSSQPVCVCVCVCVVRARVCVSEGCDVCLRAMHACVTPQNA